jgi:hypothetical protein
MARSRGLGDVYKRQGGSHAAAPADQPCHHYGSLVVTREGDAVCGVCGSVVLSGVGMFHIAQLEGAAYTWRKNSYVIQYYFNEKIAQVRLRLFPTSDSR